MDARSLSKEVRGAYPLTQFKAALEAGGLSPASIGVYLAYVRRVLREATSPDKVDVAAIVRAAHSLPYERRDSLRTAWRKYVEWAARQGFELPDPPDAGMRQDRAVVRRALPELVKHCHLTPRELYFLTIGRIKPQADHLLLYATARPNARRQPPPRKLMREHLGPFYEIMQWAYPDGAQQTPDSDAPFLPECPNGDVPMTLATIKNIIEGEKKAAKRDRRGNVVPKAPLVVIAGSKNKKAPSKALAPAQIADTQVEGAPTEAEEAELEAELLAEEQEKMRLRRADAERRAARGELPAGPGHWDQPDFAKAGQVEPWPESSSSEEKAGPGESTGNAGP